MTHFRHPKLQEQRLVLHGEYVVADPQDMAGQWRNLMPKSEGLCVDVGCGKGLWTTQAARMWENMLFVGVDYERMCISFAAEQAAVGGVASSGWAKSAEDGYVAPQNLRFAEASAMQLDTIFEPEEIDHLFLNYPTPFPRKKETAKRIVNAEHLVKYAQLLAPCGMLHFKTDSQPLFDYALDQLKLACFNVVALTRDLYSATSPESAAFTSVEKLPSAYERKTLMRGAKIHALQAVVDREAYENLAGNSGNDQEIQASQAPQPSAPQSPYSQLVEPKSLYDYLPDNLDEVTYVPLGMENALTNMRNRRNRGHGGVWGQQ